MSGALPIGMVVLPVVAAVVLALVGSWRIGVWVNLAAGSVTFLMACALQNTPATLAAFVAATTSWFGLRDVPALLAARWLTRDRTRVHHAAGQALLAAVLAAMLLDDAALAWVAGALAVGSAAVLIGAADSADAARAASRLLQFGGAGLLLALLGLVLRERAPELAGVCLLVGYGGVAGVVPLHAWLTGAAAQGTPPGAILATALLPLVAIGALLRLPLSPVGLLIVGFATVAVGGVGLLVHPDMRRGVALAGTGQIGLVLIAMGVGATRAAWLHMILLTIARAAALQAEARDSIAWLTLTLLPLYAVYRLAAAADAWAPWLLLPLAAGALLLALPLLQRCPVGRPTDWRAIAPVWLQVGAIVVMAVAMQ